MRRIQQMDVISVTTNLLKLNFVPLTSFTRCLDYDSLHLIIQQRPSVFHRKHYVVMNQPRTLTRFMNNKDAFHLPTLNPKPVPVASHGESQVERGGATLLLGFPLQPKNYEQRIRAIFQASSKGDVRLVSAELASILTDLQTPLGAAMQDTKESEIGGVPG